MWRQLTLPALIENKTGTNEVNVEAIDEAVVVVLLLCRNKMSPMWLRKRHTVGRRKGTVMFNLIENKAGTNEVNVRYLTIHLGWWLKWVTTMRTKNDLFSFLFLHTRQSWVKKTWLQMNPNHHSQQWHRRWSNFWRYCFHTFDNVWWTVLGVVQPKIEGQWPNNRRRQTTLTKGLVFSRRKRKMWWWNSTELDNPNVIYRIVYVWKYYIGDELHVLAWSEWHSQPIKSLLSRVITSFSYRLGALSL
jgi:hypothetical protein